jgi:hypothetical protein
MRAQEQSSPAARKLIGIGLGTAGLYAVLIGFGLVPVPGGRDNLHGPLWLAALIGILLLLASAACAIQIIIGSAGLAADAPRWIHVTQQFIGIAIFAASRC